MEHHDLLVKAVEKIKIEIHSSYPSWFPELNTESLHEKSINPNSQRIEKFSTKNKTDKDLITDHVQHLYVGTGDFGKNLIFLSQNDPLLYVNSWKGFDDKGFMQDKDKVLNEKITNYKKPLKQRKLPRGTYICDHCKKKFMRRTSVIRHLKIHTGIGEYRCYVCRYIFPTYCKLKIHNIVVHTDDRLFVCEICNADFTQKHSMEDHKLIHSGERPFECTTCNKNFVRRRNLNAHMKIHDCAKEHQCDICMIKFSTKSSMTKHKLRHDNPVAKRFFCDFCEKAYEQRGHLEDHLRKHTGEKPFGCDFCDKKFARIGSLNLHTRQNHTKVVSIECRFCSKTFKNERALKLHVMTHRDEKPYKCNVCNKGFGRRGNRNKHVLIHQK